MSPCRRFRRASAGSRAGRRLPATLAAPGAPSRSAAITTAGARHPPAAAGAAAGPSMWGAAVRSAGGPDAAAPAAARCRAAAPMGVMRAARLRGRDLTRRRFVSERALGATSAASPPAAVGERPGRAVGQSPARAARPRASPGRPAADRRGAAAGGRQLACERTRRAHRHRCRRHPQGWRRATSRDRDPADSPRSARRSSDLGTALPLLTLARTDVPGRLWRDRPLLYAPDDTAARAARPWRGTPDDMAPRARGGGAAGGRTRPRRARRARPPGQRRQRETCATLGRRGRADPGRRITGWPARGGDARGGGG